MNTKIIRLITFISLLFPGMSSSFVMAQAPVADSAVLPLDSVIARVVRTNPAIFQAQEGLKASDASADLIKSAYRPHVNASASYSRIGPVPSFDFPGFGTIKLYPEDNYSASVDYSQLIWDFGKTAKSLDVEKVNHEIASLTVNMTRQQLALFTTEIYYNLAFLKSAVKINDDQLKVLNEHLDFIRKKQETGSATQYEILSTKVKISTVESRQVDLQSAITSQLAVLNSLLGNNVSTPVNVAPLSDMPDKPVVTDSLVSYALAHRYEVELAKENEQKASLQYDVAAAGNHPTLSAFLSGGGKNGYVPDLYSFKANYVAGVSFKVPLFDGNIRKNKMILARTGMESSSYQTDITMRKISAEVVEANSSCHSAAEKTDQYKLQVEQAKEALKLANINYKAGAITNLALLDADTALSESQLMLLKARTDYAISLSKLQAALGNLLY